MLVFGGLKPLFEGWASWILLLLVRFRSSNVDQMSQFQNLNPKEIDHGQENFGSQGQSSKLDPNQVEW